MSNIKIPPAALEAGARALADAYYRNCTDGRLTMADTDDTPEDWYVEARAAFLAMVEAWPGMSHAHNEEGEIKDWATWYSLPWYRAESSNGIILPLPSNDSSPQETRDDE